MLTNRDKIKYLAWSSRKFESTSEIKSSDRVYWLDNPNLALADQFYLPELIKNMNNSPPIRVCILKSAEKNVNAIKSTHIRGYDKFIRFQSFYENFSNLKAGSFCHSQELSHSKTIANCAEWV